MPALIAHRGYPRQYPENTLAGIEAAIDVGARHIEVDVQLSADGVPVLCHDDALQRLWGLPGHITALGSAAIRGLRVGGEPVALLADLAGLLQDHPGVHAFVELKPESIEVAGPSAMLDAVSGLLAPLAKRCTLISYDVGVLGLAMDQGWAAGWVSDAWPGALPAALGRGLVAWFCDVAALPAVGPVNPFTVPLAVYDVTEAAKAQHLSQRGAAYVETFDIDAMRRALPGWA